MIQGRIRIAGNYICKKDVKLFMDYVIIKEESSFYIN